MVECHHDFSAKKTQDDEVKRMEYFIIPAETAPEKVVDGKTISHVEGKPLVDNVTDLVADIRATVQRSQYLNKMPDTHVREINVEHAEMLGFYGKALKYIQQVTSPATC